MVSKGKRFKASESKSHKNKNRFMLFLVIVFIVSSIIVCAKLFSRRRKNKETKEIKTFLSDKKSTKIEKLEELQKVNSDIVALIEIENSNINYPVLQTKDNEFYMTHDYKKDYSKDGSLFLDKNYNWSKPSMNLLIYGHNNIGSTEMFAELMNYKDENYYNTHKTIKFTTNEEEATYEIISVFLSRVYYKSEKDVFRYYYFIDANNEEEYNNYVENSKKASLYKIEATAKYGDQLLTLSTCEYSQKDGRLAVVARKITE